MLDMDFRFFDEVSEIAFTFYLGTGYQLDEHNVDGTSW